MRGTERGGYGWDVLYERIIKKKRKKSCGDLWRRNEKELLEMGGYTWEELLHFSYL